MIKPMLCKTQAEPFTNPDYIWEQKYDGIRLVAMVDGKTVRLWGRSGAEKTALFPELKIETKFSAILDGEVISGDGFNGIQHRANRQNGIAAAAKEYPAVYHVFDVLSARDINLEGITLDNRKTILASLLVPTNNVLVAPFWENGKGLFETAKANQWEGIVGKSKTGSYQQNKREWLKVKVWQTGKFLVVGYTQGTGWRASTFGALVLSDAKGRYVGAVGTGFNDGDISDLFRSFSPATCPFPREPEPATWVKPFVVTIRYMEVTNDGMLRFPSFKGVV